MKKIFENLLAKAIHTINLNTHTTENGLEYVFAGGNQFRTMWTRDFCYSVSGLLKIKKYSLVKNQLKTIFEFRSPDGILPRGIDRVSPKLRVVLNTMVPKSIRPNLNYAKNDALFQSQIRAEYLGEHNTIAIDSNALYMLAFFSYANETNDYFLNEAQIESLFEVYSKRLKEGLVYQPDFSDWQDSVKRNGAWLLLQIQILVALVQFKKWTGREVPGFSIAKYQDDILKAFFDFEKYVFYQSAQYQTLALDYYGFIFKHKVFQDKIDFNRLYANLKKHSLWAQHVVPGIPVSQAYAASQISWTNKMVGLSGYHDHYYWGWLVAESAHIAKINGDSVEHNRILNLYYQSTEAIDSLSEIYLNKEARLIEFSNFFYKSESPFTWTASKWCEALATDS